MTVKFHRCSNEWVKIGGHPCWRVQKALDESGVDYEMVKHPAFPRSKRAEYIELAGTDRLPAIELEDGTIIREDSKELAARIREGRLGEASPA
jgi:glutaredoxin